MQGFVEPEQKLFIHVLIQEIEDFSVDSPVGANDEERELAKVQAIAWFKGNSSDYQEVCDNAGVHAGWLRKKVLTSNKAELQELLNEYYKLIRPS